MRRDEANKRRHEGRQAKRGTGNKAARQQGGPTNHSPRSASGAKLSLHCSVFNSFVSLCLIFSRHPHSTPHHPSSTPHPLRHPHLPPIAGEHCIDNQAWGKTSKRKNLAGRHPNTDRTLTRNMEETAGRASSPSPSPTPSPTMPERVVNVEFCTRSSLTSYRRFLPCSSSSSPPSSLSFSRCLPCTSADAAAVLYVLLVAS